MKHEGNLSCCVVTYRVSTMVGQMIYQGIICLLSVEGTNSQQVSSSNTSSPPQPPTVNGGGLDFTSLDPALQFYFEQGLAQSTQCTYRAAMKRFVEFCSQYMIFNPFPLSEKLLCYYAVFMAK